MRRSCRRAPGHVDFSAEAERALQALDAAILVVGANDGVQGYTETLWELLARRALPTFVFVNKTDLPNPGRAELLAQLRRLSPACLDASELAAAGAALEGAAATDEAALDEYLETGALSGATLRRLVGERKVAPVLFDSALAGRARPRCSMPLLRWRPVPSGPMPLPPACIA